MHGFSGSILSLIIGIILLIFPEFAYMSWLVKRDSDSREIELKIARIFGVVLIIFSIISLILFYIKGK